MGGVLYGRFVVLGLIRVFLSLGIIMVTFFITPAFYLNSKYAEILAYRCV
jgi:hypothetical protein